MKKKELEKEALSQLSTEDYIARVTTTHTLGMQERIVRFLLRIYVGAISASFTLVFLQGFKLGGFELPADFLKWLGGITIGELAGLLSLAIGAAFRSITYKPPKPPGEPPLEP